MAKEKLDISDYRSVKHTIAKIKPNFVLNCAMLRNELCDNNPVQAYRVNTLGTFHLAAACAEAGCTFIHISSDYVFDGTYGQPYTETMQTNSQSWYGRSKALGEALALQIHQKTFIARTAWLYGRFGDNFVHKIIKKAAYNKKIQVVKDQIGSPTSVRVLMSMIQNLMESDRYGIYHTVCSGRTSRSEMAKVILEQCGLDCVLQEISSEGQTGIIDTSLSTDKFCNNFSYKPPHWKTELIDYLAGSKIDIIREEVSG